MTRAYLIGIQLALALNSVCAATYPSRCEPDTVSGVLERSSSVFWVFPSEGGDERIWLKGQSDSLVVPPDHFNRQCTFLAFVDDNGQQVFPCAGWSVDYSLPSAGLTISAALSDGQSCGRDCSDKLEDLVMILNGKASPGNPINFPLTADERRALILARAREDLRQFPHFQILPDEWGLPECFKVDAREFQQAVSKRLDSEEN